MVQLPERALVDVQRSTEYVVDAVRALHQRTGRKVSLLGHSQGAMEIRWAVRWWPDVRAVVDDVVTVAGANRPIPWTGPAFCHASCADPFWQFSTGSVFLEALNRVPTPEGPSYTAVRSLNDLLIQPALPESEAVGAIDGASNVVLQDICPGREVNHTSIVFDAVLAEVVLDALTHAGSADASRIDRGACARFTPEEVDPAFAAASIATLYVNAFAAIATGPRSSSEPPLREYARGQ